MTKTMWNWRRDKKCLLSDEQVAVAVQVSVWRIWRADLTRERKKQNHTIDLLSVSTDAFRGDKRTLLPPSPRSGEEREVSKRRLFLSGSVLLSLVCLWLSLSFSPKCFKEARRGIKEKLVSGNTILYCSNSTRKTVSKSDPVISLCIFIYLPTCS